MAENKIVYVSGEQVTREALQAFAVVIALVVTAEIPDTAREALTRRAAELQIDVLAALGAVGGETEREALVEQVIRGVRNMRADAVERFGQPLIIPDLPDPIG